MSWYQTWGWTVQCDKCGRELHIEMEPVENMDKMFKSIIADDE